MDATHTDELYEILDELNARIEDVFNECGSPEECDLFMQQLRQKTHEFVDELEHEIETIELIGSDA